MKPGEHPEFFRLPPPPGRSRESTIRLDAEGRFWHGGQLVEHPGMARAFASWIRRHPDDGRYVLSNDYDWTYFEVEDAPFFVVSLEAGEIELSDGSREPFDPSKLWIGPAERVYTRVKQGQFVAAFSRHAQLALAELLVDDGSGEPAIEVGGRHVRIPQSDPAQGS